MRLPRADVFPYVTRRRRLRVRSHGASSAGRTRSRSRWCGVIGLVAMVICLALASCRRTSSADRAVRHPQGGSAGWPSSWPAPATTSARRARGDRPLSMAPTRRCSAPVLFWAFQIVGAAAGVPRVRQRAAARGAGSGFFVGMLGNLLPMPGGSGRRGGRDHRDVRRVRRERRARRRRRAASTGPSRSALPIVPGVVAYFQLRRTVDRWQAQPTAASA